MTAPDPGLRVISESQEPEADRRVWKIVLWGALSVAAGFFFAASFERWLLTFNGLYFWSLIISAVLFWSFATLQVLFIKGLGKLAFITFLECLAPLALFYSRIYPAPSYVLLGGAGATFILAFLAVRRGRSFSMNSVELRFLDIAKVFLPRFAAAWLVFLSVLFYLSYFSWGYFSPNLKATFLDSIVSTAEPLLKVWIPDFSPNTSVQGFIENLARSELSAGKYNPLGVSDKSFTVQFSQLSQAQQNDLVTTATNELEQTFTARFGKFDPQESMRQFADGIITNYFESFMGHTGWLTPVLVAAAVFFFLKGIVALFYWLITFIAFIIFRLALIFGFASTNIESRSREFVLL